MYPRRIDAVLSPGERRLFKRLSTPQKIQDYLDRLPINFETAGETYMSPRRTVAAQTAHCFEGALLAAAVLAWHGQEPLLLDLKSVPSDEDHVVALFMQAGRWGAISKTNHPILRYRDPVYVTPRELALSYFHEYLLENRRKCMRSYSRPFKLSRYAPEAWVTAAADLYWLVDALDESKHEEIAPQKNMRLLRRAAPIEIDAQRATEWPDPRAARNQK